MNKMQSTAHEANIKKKEKRKPPFQTKKILYSYRSFTSQDKHPKIPSFSVAKGQPTLWMSLHCLMGILNHVNNNKEVLNMQ